MILALPPVPRHEHCQAPAVVAAGPASVGSAMQAEPAPEHPFAVLSGLKRPRD
jgi:uncharacterized metal-binding protein YceD (DUF177 family)